MRARGEVSDADWALLRPLLQFPRRADGRGRPPADTRAVLNGVLWILRTGAQWRELPKKYPPYQTVHGRFQQWVNDLARMVLASMQIEKRPKKSVLWPGVTPEQVSMKFIPACRDAGVEDFSLHDLRQHADFLIMPTWYSKPVQAALEAHWESA